MCGKAVPASQQFHQKASGHLSDKILEARREVGQAQLNFLLPSYSQYQPSPDDL